MCYDYDIGSGVFEAPQACPYLTSLALASLYTARVASCHRAGETHLSAISSIPANVILQNLMKSHETIR